MDIGAIAAWTGENILEISLAFLNLQSVDTIICELTEKKIIYKRSVRFNADGLRGWWWLACYCDSCWN